MSTASEVVSNSVRKSRGEFVGVDASNITLTASFEDRRWSTRLQDDVLVVDVRARIYLGKKMRTRMKKDKRNRI